MSISPATLYPSGGFHLSTHHLAAVAARLHEDLVPMFGAAESVHGEMLRCAVNLYLDATLRHYAGRDSLTEELDTLDRLKPSWLPYLDGGASPDWDEACLWAARLGETTSATDVGEHGALGARLEKLLTAVVRYVAAQEGLTIAWPPGPAYH